MLEYGGLSLVWKLVLSSPENFSRIVSLMKFLTISLFSLTDSDYVGTGSPGLI